MKKIFIILYLWPTLLFSQVADTCFTSTEIVQISETIDSLHYLDSVNNKIILEQEVLISDLEKVIKLDSLENLYLSQKNKFLDENIDLYIEREKLLQPKWYDKKGIWFGAGILTTLLTGKLIVEVVQ
tara:strand:- start:300 stop:680 length:381 start_codon:yes stop_codon:yes gene_type:complete